VRVVLDTNCVISGLFWQGAPRQILDLARAGRIELYTSLHLLAELADVLKRPKFSARLRAAAADASTLVIGYAALAHVVKHPPKIPPLCRDPNDDEVLACANAANASLIISGDKDLLTLVRYKRIAIMDGKAGLAWVLSRTPP
jgi:putative PIN family toxin of toxin-antitoxin system